MHTSSRKVLCIVLVIVLAPMLNAQDTDEAFPDRGPDLTGVWEVVFEDGRTSRLELVQRGDSLFGYIASSTPISGVCTSAGSLELRTLDSMIVSKTRGDTISTFVLEEPNPTEFKGRVEPYSSSAVDRYATSIKGTMFVMDRNSGDIIIHKRFSAAKRFNTELPSWMKPKTETIEEYMERPQVK